MIQSKSGQVTPQLKNTSSAPNNLETMATKIKELQAMLTQKEGPNKTDNDEDDEDIVYPFDPIDIDEVRNHSSSSSETESDHESVNSAKDSPFLSTIGGHKFRDNGAISFRCHDTDDDNESWCDANKAITNVGKKVFNTYVKENKLKKASYNPVSVKPVSKKDLRKVANKAKAKQNVEKVMLKITNKRRSLEGVIYKVMTDDLKETWKTKNEIGPHFDRLVTEYVERQSSGQSSDTSKQRQSSGQSSDTSKSPKKSKQPKKKTIASKSPKKSKQPKKKTIASKSPKKSKQPKKKTTASKSPKKSIQPKKKTTVSKTTKKRKVLEPKKKQPVKDKPFVCRLNHKQYQTYKAESDKNWFADNQRFGNSVCFICKKSIQSKSNDDNFVPSTAKPAYICINSTKNCKKCLCHFCCAKLMVSDTTTNAQNNRRSTRKRS